MGQEVKRGSRKDIAVQRTVPEYTATGEFFQCGRRLAGFFGSGPAALIIHAAMPGSDHRWGLRHFQQHEFGGGRMDKRFDAHIVGAGMRKHRS